MKKLSIFILFLMLTGCGGASKIVCDANINNDSENYQSKVHYVINAKNNYVDKVSIEESYISNDKEKLNYFENYLKVNYNNLNENYGGYNFYSKDIENGIAYVIDIDYTKVDIEKMVKDNKIDKSYVKNSKVLVSGLQKEYEAKGAVCK